MGKRPTGAGLSPRVRGNPPRRTVSGWTGRSIPACAGEPYAYPLRPHPRAVYPRVCGGTPALTTGPRERQGLSPRVRGNLGHPAGDEVAVGSIPACAGEPPTSACHWTSDRVYPRVCGGTDLIIGVPGHPEGLSPRVRGNPEATISYNPAPRSIPACAGEPTSIFVPLSCREVYPRVCGGTPSRAPLAAPGSGLSPRVRGNLSPAGE